MQKLTLIGTKERKLLITEGDKTDTLNDFKGPISTVVIKNNRVKATYHRIGKVEFTGRTEYLNEGVEWMKMNRKGVVLPSEILAILKQ